MTEEDARIYLALGITPNEVVRLRWPDVTDIEADHILWEHTPFPLVSGLLDIVEAIAEIDKLCEYISAAERNWTAQPLER